MESQDNISPSNVEESDMGNEVSHREGVKQSVGGEGHTGQFHKVLVEPKISQESDVIVTDTQPSENIHAQATLKIRGVVATEKNETDAEQQRPNISDEEYKLIAKCKALITEAAGRAEERQSLARPSCTEQVTDIDEISHDEGGDDVFAVEQKNTNEKQTTNEIVDLDTTYTNIGDLSDKQPEKTAKSHSPKTSPTKNKNYALKCGIVTETALDEKTKGESKVKQKQKAVDEKKQSSTASPSRSSESKCKNNSENTEAVVKQSPKRNPLKMFKFSKRKTKVNADVTSDKNAKKIDGIEEDVNEEIVNSSNVSDGEIVSNGNVIKRLNSLDSGIVVDKVTDQQNIGGVEYAVVQKKKTTGLTPTKQVDKDDSPRKSETENGNTNPDESSEQNNGKDHDTGKDAVYMNGNRDDQDFVYINERAIDVSGLVEPVTNKVLETLPNVKDDAGGSDITSERSGNEAEIQSIISSDSCASSGTKYKIIDKEKPEKAKLKKKSWSFQVLGKKDKKGSDGLDVESGSRVSMDPSASPPPEIKKSKWLFGKFSFRRSSDDMTSSTPNLQQAGIPEEQEAGGVNVKSKSKLKKKGKEKKRKSPKKEVTSLERRSTSLMDIVIGDSNAPRSRRNSSNQGVNQGIIEDDIEYTPTDAFEGVTLSDLSQDEEAETEVTLNPAGAKTSSKEKNNKTEKKGKPKTPVDAADDKLTNLAKIKHIADDSPVKVSATAASDKVEDEYMNVVDVGKSTEASIDADNKFTSEIVEDEYVNVSNVVAAKSEPVESVTGAPGHEIIGVDGDEYAVVMKKPAVIESNNAKESIETSDVKEDDELMKEYGLDKTQIIENNVEKETAEDVVVPVSNEKAYSNMIYSDEEFNATLSKLTESNDDNKVKTVERVEDKELDEYVQLKDIVQDHTDETASVETEGIDPENKNVTETSITEDTIPENKNETEPVKTENVAPENKNVTETVKTQDIVPENENVETENVAPENKDSSESMNLEGEPVCNDDTSVTENVAEEIESNKEENIDEGREIVEEESIIPENKVKVETNPGSTGQSKEIVDENTVSENIVNVENQPQDAEMEQALSSPIKTVVMKDIGVQVPDIHMPLDIEADFGNNSGEVTSTSIGIQVDCKDLDDVSHIVVTMATNKEPTPPSEV